MRALGDERQRLLDFARASASSAAGFSWLDDQGRPDPTQPVFTWVTARMTHVFALAHLDGVADCLPLVEHGVAALAGPLPDSAYDHAFVALALSSAVAAGVPAEALLTDVLARIESRYLDESGKVIDSVAEADSYRGANSSMHLVEAFLAVGDVTGDPVWHQRALRITSHLIHGVAREFGYRLPEHFTAAWEPLPNYNADQPADKFRPFGCTPGHLFEWSRLLLHLEASLDDPPAWLLSDAVALFDRAVALAWAVDGAPGFVYTTDWDDVPVVRSRMHWVHAEAVLAAWALSTRTGESSYDEWAKLWWAFIDEHLIDPVGGSWWHELDMDNQPASTVWPGKPDVYHAFQAALFPELALAPSAATQLGSTDGRRRERHQTGATPHRGPRGIESASERFRGVVAWRPARRQAGGLSSVGNAASVPGWWRAAGGGRWIRAQLRRRR